MRSSIVAALAASTILAMASAASAQTAQQSSDTSNVNRANNTDYGMTAAQEDTIPYRACSIAVGWVDGHLVCRNKY